MPPERGVGGEVDLAPADANRARQRVRVIAAQDSPQPGQEFFHRERLGDIVVGAGVERSDLVPRPGAARQDDDRGPGPPAQSLDHLDAVHIGQPEVKDDRIRWPPGCLGERVAAGRGGGDVVTAHAQVDAQGAEHRGLVIDHQHPGPDGGSGDPGLTPGDRHRHRRPARLSARQRASGQGRR